MKALKMHIKDYIFCFLGVGVMGIALKLFYLTYVSLATNQLIALHPICFLDWLCVLTLSAFVFITYFSRIVNRYFEGAKNVQSR